MIIYAFRKKSPASHEVGLMEPTRVSTNMNVNDSIEVVVRAISNKAYGIKALELRRPDGGDLPAFTAGAHIDLQLPIGMVRSYSLCNSQDDRDRYVVAINKDPASTGGSRFIHETLRAGDTLRIACPRNNFPLVESARHTVFIAGGIGITPIYGMVQRMEKLGRRWELYYSARTREMCAFEQEMRALEFDQPGRVHLNFDQAPGGTATDLKALIAGLPDDAHYYCCGPNSMLKAFETACADAGRPQGQVHVEYFKAKAEASVDGGFTVVLQRSGKSYVIPPGKTILNELLDQMVDVPHSCTQGVCGTCETKVLEGVPDHRDSVLNPEEQASNKTMMICCSGSKTAKLVLDL